MSTAMLVEEGGTVATIRYSKHTGEHLYSLSVTILIPSLFNKCNTKGKLNAAVKAYGRRRKTLFLDMFYAKMLKKDRRFECMKNFDGGEEEEECYVHRVSGVFRVHGPIAGGDFKLLDAFFESSEQ